MRIGRFHQYSGDPNHGVISTAVLKIFKIRENWIDLIVLFSSSSSSFFFFLLLLPSSSSFFFLLLLLLVLSKLKHQKHNPSPLLQNSYLLAQAQSSRIHSPVKCRQPYWSYAIWIHLGFIHHTSPPSLWLISPLLISFLLLISHLDTSLLLILQVSSPPPWHDEAWPSSPTGDVPGLNLVLGFDAIQKNPQRLPFQWVIRIIPKWLVGMRWVEILCGMFL